jgi:hypothetical protein
MSWRVMWLEMVCMRTQAAHVTLDTRTHSSQTKAVWSISLV